MTLALSAIICTHNPREAVLAETLAALRAQDLAPGLWELIVVDNASAVPLAGRLDVAGFGAARVVREERLGLTHARIRGFREARGETLVYIDDDNVLDAGYLRLALDALRGDPRLGAVGGRSIPRYEVPPPAWFAGLGIDLACRDLGDRSLFADWTGLAPAERTYPVCAPIGAGMAIRRDAYGAYLEAAGADPVRTALGRRGSDLASGEDNDMILSLLGAGWTVAYLPQLRLEHLIPAGRLRPDYLARYAYSSNRTWVQVLDVHGMRPWPPAAPWSTGLRKARAWLACRAWRGQADRIRWRSACGLIDGRALLGPRA